MFAVDPDAYDRYMGRHSRLVAPQLLSFSGVEPGMRALDVGCGAGALTSALVDQLGTGNVAAADPSEALAAACADRFPGIDVRRAPAEGLPWPDASFDVVLSQLVLNLLDDADAGIEEMCRIVRPGGTVASCTWDYAEGMQMLRIFWGAALELDPTAPDEGTFMRYCSREELAALWRDHGLTNVETAPLTIETRFDGFADYWEPFTSGVGPGGAYGASLDDGHRAELRERCFRRLGSPTTAFSLPARAFAVRGRRPDRTRESVSLRRR